MDDVLILLTEQTEKDKYGVPQATYAARQIFAKVNSIERAEFFAAGRNGLNPEFRFDVFAGDYAGETVCQYKDQTYAIYRAYHVPGTDYLELYVIRKGGTNGIETDSD